MKSEIIFHLPKDFPWSSNILYFDSIDSTNTYAKLIAAQGACHGTVVVAGSQTSGRGRMGRSFHSPENCGIYLSVILRPDCPASQLMHLTCAAGVAMCDALQESANIRPGIKWINDLVLGSKKIGGILTELSMHSDGHVDYAVVGIGINCNQAASDFPCELQKIATSLFSATGRIIDLPKLAAAMIYHLKSMSDTMLANQKRIMERYASDCVTLQKEVVIHTAGGVRRGYAYGIDNEGALLVRFSDGSCNAISSGEASVRGMYGYA